LPIGWRWEPLDGVAPVNPRRNFDGIAADAELTFLGMAAVSELTGALILTEQRPLAAVRSGFTRFQSGDVIFAKITPCMENGKLAIIPDLPHGMGAGSTEFHVLQPDQVSARYLFHWLSQETFRNRAEHNMTGTAGQKRVPADWLRNAPIPVPPTIEEQVAIVSRIDTLFAEIDEGEAALAEARAGVETYRKALLKAAVTGELTADWRKANPQQETGQQLLQRILADRRARWHADPKNTRKKYKEPEGPDRGLADIPEGWTCARLEQLTTKIVDGTHHTPTYVSTGIPFLSVKDVRDGKLHFENCRYITPGEHADLTKRCNPEGGDLLVTKSGTIGRTAVVRTDQAFSLFVSVALLKPASSFISGEWLEFAFHHWFRNADVSQDVKGTAIKNLHLEDFRELVVPLPPLNEQTAIMARFEEQSAKVPTRMFDPMMIGASSLRQSILAAAFRGELKA